MYGVVGIPRIYQIDDVLKTEPQVAHLIGLPQFFDQSTAHRYLNRFGKWHVSQLDRVNTQVLLAHGESARQDVVILDIDSQTHTLESRKREQAVVGRNRKKPGRPCMQWNVGFVRGEAVSQRLQAGNTHGSQSLQWIIEDVLKKLDQPMSILRLDGGYLSKNTLDYVDGICEIRLNKLFPYQSEVVFILKMLWQQVKVQQANTICFPKSTKH